MSKIRADLKYTKSHEWIKIGDDGSLSIGITDHAQEALGDIVFVEVPQKGRKLKAGEACAVVESVKAASDIYSPVAGEVLEGNAKLADKPESINQDAFANWILRLKPANPADLNQLLDAKAYEKVLADEAQ
ncbi:MAG: glycine cleavage system protein GcvH [Gammaproteobacteria bacterium]|nr:glycine cleavage system protein GcvH [Gammaproteobacteria bacterium]MDE1886931.1 glycine cleavage system protein GcvH [Gammaproteobacteria bacterium]MDE2024535.1 glycine cleavage system protein GcvH [Gammaproteobacteria bacterium]MDE2140553.1 glycine cleavage system protein GcvH [Gammaproteobacteria bacterium]MDE2273885.1 glycine cleavage system protein GcvH [Gammaproteobacteria bacterium]